MTFLLSIFSKLSTAGMSHRSRLLSRALGAVLIAYLAYATFATHQPSSSPPQPALTLTTGPILISEELPPPAPAASTLSVLVKRGDTLSSLFKRANFGADLVDRLKKLASDKDVLGKLRPGHELIFTINNKDHALTALRIVKSPTESHNFEKTPTGEFKYAMVVRTPELRQASKEAVITDSLFGAGQRVGIPDWMTMELNTIFGGVIDFILDTREGDTFKLLYEEKYLDGSQIGFGRILAAEFTNQGKIFTAVRYTDKDGNSGFYSPAGQSMKKTFWLNPVDFTRVSSNFSAARKHPILNTIRAHKGTDYSAPKGTPVKATADGRVTFVDRNGSYGKLVVIQHGDHYQTKYAHLNDYKKGLKAGVRIHQGDIIGYVGATGAATGPHLHYEFLVDGVAKDSRKITDQLPQAGISNKDKANFDKQIVPLLSALHKNSPAPMNTATSL
jgi:murein DD-endopeptidase MepM/ murein hydrolase activator NlpD